MHCHFIYGIHIWSSTLPSNLTALILKQKAAIRVISSAPYNAHTEPLFKKLNILPLVNLIEYFKLQFMHRFLSNELPISFANMWTVNADRQRTNQTEDAMLLRNHQDLFIPPCRLASSEVFPLYSFPRIWTNFPAAVANCLLNKKEFDTQLKKHFIDSLRANYTCERLLCPHCHLNV